MNPAHLTKLEPLTQERPGARPQQDATADPTQLNVTRSRPFKAPLLALTAIAASFALIYEGATYYNHHHRKMSTNVPAQASKGVDSSLLGPLGATTQPAPPVAAPTQGSAPTDVAQQQPHAVGSAAGIGAPGQGHSAAGPSQELQNLRDKLDVLNDALETMQSKVEQLQTDVGDMHGKLTKLLRPHVVRHPKVTEPKPVPQVQQEAPPPSARVMSVDIWGGRPSVSVSQGGEIKFLNEGDSLNGFVLKDANPKSQQAEFATPAGGSRRVTSSAGDGQ